MILVTPPASTVVSLADLKAHLRVDGTDEDLLITTLEAAAVGYLDGWRGVLGRAILSQVWRQEFDGWGDLRLAMPDVSAVAVTYLDKDGVEQPATTATLRQTATGPYVEADGPASDRIFVNMTCAMSAQMRATAVMIVKLLVAHWYENRVTVAPANMAEMPVAASALVNAIRWSAV